MVKLSSFNIKIARGKKGNLGKWEEYRRLDNIKITKMKNESGSSAEGMEELSSFNIKIARIETSKLKRSNKFFCYFINRGYKCVPVNCRGENNFFGNLIKKTRNFIRYFV